MVNDNAKRLQPTAFHVYLRRTRRRPHKQMAASALARSLGASGLDVDVSGAVDWTLTPRTAWDPESLLEVPDWLQAPEAEGVSYRLVVGGQSRRLALSRGVNGWYTLTTIPATPLDVARVAGARLNLRLEVEAPLGKCRELATAALLAGSFQVPPTLDHMGVPGTMVMGESAGKDRTFVVFLHAAEVGGAQRYVGATVNLRLE